MGAVALAGRMGASMLPAVASAAAGISRLRWPDMLRLTASALPGGRSWMEPDQARRHSCASASASETGRESLQYDVCVVGAGPAGLSAAIRIKQLEQEQGREVQVCVIDKAAEVGGHTISGNVFEPRALDELLPDWREQGAPVRVPVSRDRFWLLSKRWRWWLPTPPSAKNHGNYVISLSELTRWLAEKAEALGVEVFPGFAASELLYHPDGSVAGVATRELGRSKDGSRKPGYEPGVELRAGATLLAEGCRGSLSEEAMKAFKMRDPVDCRQSYALGVKELWRVEPSKHREGTVWHTMGWPLDHATYGGGFLYHMDGERVALGLVVALDYSNPYLSPFQEFQRWKTHPGVRWLMEGGECLEYGARTLNEGGLQSLPARLTFPGGAIIGCSAGFLNVAKIKGTHTAMKSGMLAGEAAFHAAAAAEQPGKALDVSAYDSWLRKSWVWTELEQVRNIRPGFRWGLVPGLVHAGLDTYLMGGAAPWTLKHGRPDHERLRPAAECTPMQYPPPDCKVTFDLQTSLYRSGTNHDHDQPAHLRLRNPGVPAVVNKRIYDGPESRYCPAGVYEYATDPATGREQLRINAQNCLHCKACDIKDPTQNIRWTVPEGGGGPGYSCM